MMAHSLSSAPLAPPATATLHRKNMYTCNPPRVVSMDRSHNFHGARAHANVVTDRRSVALGLAGAALGLNLLMGDESANAAGRRPPPGPPKEKQDPNITGLAAKVLASKKRKEDMKETVAKLRQQGKPAAAAASKQE